MSLALFINTLGLIILVSPGLFFSRAFRAGRYSLLYKKVNLTSEIIAGSVVSFYFFDGAVKA